MHTHADTAIKRASVQPETQKTGQDSFIAEISPRLSGIPSVGLCRLPRFLVNLIGHAFHVPGTKCV